MGGAPLIVFPYRRDNRKEQYEASITDVPQGYGWFHRNVIVYLTKIGVLLTSNVVKLRHLNVHVIRSSCGERLMKRHVLFIFL